MMGDVNSVKYGKGWIKEKVNFYVSMNVLCSREGEETRLVIGSSMR